MGKGKISGRGGASWLRWWLASEEGHPKHSGWLHPIVVCALVTASVIAIMLRLADAVEAPSQTPPKPRQLYAAQGLLGYTAVLFVVRVAATGSYALYEFLWACNQALLLAALGLASSRPLLVAAGVVAVSVDQVLWYVDVLGFFLTLGRKFPIGVAKYITWPETSWARRLTSTHHLWFIPVCLAFGPGPMPLLGYPLSVAFVAVLNVMCRCVTPFRLPSQPQSTSPSAAGTVVWAGASTTASTTARRRRSLRLLEKQQQQQMNEGDADGSRYLNVNLVYELWKDIDVSFLKVSHPHPAVHLTRLVVLWSLLNVPFAAVLFPLSGSRWFD